MYFNMKVRSTRTTIFPKLGWSIRRGAIKELPKEQAAREAILASNFITIVDSPAPEKPCNQEPVQPDSDD